MLLLARLSSVSELVSLTKALRAAALRSRLACFSASSSISASKSLSLALLILARLAAALLKSSSAASANFDHLVKLGLTSSRSVSPGPNLGRRRKADSASSRATRALLVLSLSFSSMASLVT